ncbi:MAG: relaxase/mobilization nuclease domain-containing protein [Janthinobacterium lividum]
MKGDLKRPEVLAVNGVRMSSAGEMAADFELQRGTRPGLRQAVEHIALAWLPQETEKLTNEVMGRAAMLYLEERGIDPATTQWALVRHHDQEHPHCHLLLNRVTDDGQVLPDKRSHLRSAEACRKVEAAMGFEDAAQLGAAAKLREAVEGKLPADVAERVQYKDLIRKALEKHLPTATTVQELREALATEGVRMKATLQQGGQLQAVVFEATKYPGLHVKGSEVAREYSGVGLRKTLEAQAEHRAQTDSMVKLPQQPAAPAVPEPAATLHSTSVASAMLPEGALPVAPRPIVAASVEGQVAVASAEADKKLPPTLVANQVPAVPQPEQNVLPPVLAVAAVPPLAEAAGLLAGWQEAPASPVDRSPLGRVESADLAAAAIAQPLPSEPGRSTQAAAIPSVEVPLSVHSDSLDNAAGTASVVESNAFWQHGIIQMLATEKVTSDERLSRVQAALIAAGATVGEIVPPTMGRNKVALLPYSFDPTSTRLAEVNAVLHDVQAAYNSKGDSTSRVKEQPHSWHQPQALPEADHLEWPAREGQFNQAQIVVNDPVRGQARAERVAEELRRAGASVSEATRDNQGLLTMQVHYHTCAPTVSDIDTVLAQVAGTSVTGMEVKESLQNKDARLDGVVLVAVRQEETSTGKEMGD